MTVKDLILNLKEFDPDTPVWVCDEIEGNDSPLTGLTPSHTPVDSCNKKSRSHPILLLRWNGGTVFDPKI